MDDRELVRELSRRAEVPEAAAGAVVTALRALAREGRVSEEALRPLPHRTEDPRAVDALIEAARRHPLGIEYLRSGYLGSVAAEFRAHAFTVEAARERLAEIEPEVAACR